MISFTRFLAWVYLVASLITIVIYLSNSNYELTTLIAFGILFQGLLIFCLISLVCNIADNTTRTEPQDLKTHVLDEQFVSPEPLPKSEEDITAEALIRAVKNCDYSEAKKLVLSGADVNSLNSKGESAIEIAKKNNDKLIISLLEKHGEK